MLSTTPFAAAHAAGVAAGTSIENTATATYNPGGGTVSVQSNTVTIKVDELINVAVAALTTSPVSSTSSPPVLKFSVTNTGNGSEAFYLAGNGAVSGNPFTVSVNSIVIDSNGNGVYDAGVDTVLAPGATTADLAADQSITVFVLVSAPGGAVDGAVANTALTATAKTGTGSAGTVFAGAGAGGVDAIIGLSEGDDLGQAGLVVGTVALGLAKSATILDPFGGNRPVPGAVITYQIVSTVTGSATAQGVHVTDAIPSGTTYQTGTLKLNSAALTDAADSDAGSASSSGIDVSLGDRTGGSTDTVTFKVKIN